MIFFRSGRRVRREAAEWVARLGGGAGGEEHAAFRTWYDSDPRNAEAYDRMAAIWSAAGQLPRPVKASRGSGAGWRRGLVYAVAASLLAVAALAFMLRGGSTGAGEPSVAYATARGELRDFALPDGSRVTLDAASRIEVAFTGEERRLVLREGRARFTVAHETRPFIVQAGTEQIVATGTVFDVSLLGQRVAVVMLEGSVEIRRSGAAPPVPRLAAGQRLVIRGQGDATVMTSTRGDTSWASRMLEFDDVPLAEAVAIVNRYGGARLSLADAALGRLRVSGAFRTGDVPGFARAAAAALGLRLVPQPDGGLLFVRGDSPPR